MIAALIDGQSMMHNVSGNEFSGCFADLAKRVAGDVQVTDRVPATTVNLVVIRGAVALVVIPVVLLAMECAEALCGEFAAAGVAAIARQAAGHERTPFRS